MSQLKAAPALIPRLRLAPVFPTDPRYPALVRGFNQRFVGNPRYVQLCSDTEHVQEAVQEAVDANLRITVRSGGHCYEDFVAHNEQGVLIDISPLNGVYKEHGLFCIEAGCTLWNVYTQLFKEYGVTLPAGSCYSVGVGGHFVGGGYGMLSRKYGLTVDYLVGVELVHVTREGKAEIIKVCRDSVDAHEQDLYWAHRGGGGGNFGVITRYWFQHLPPAPAMAYLTEVVWNWWEMNQGQFQQLITRYGAFFAQHSDVESPYKDLYAHLRLFHRSAQQISMTIQYVGEHPELVDVFLQTLNGPGMAPMHAGVTRELP
jgi:FAD/FMN-containing dehydrogenase